MSTGAQWLTVSIKNSSRLFNIDTAAINPNTQHCLNSLASLNSVNHLKLFPTYYWRTVCSESRKSIVDTAMPSESKIRGVR